MYILAVIVHITEPQLLASQLQAHLRHFEQGTAGLQETRNRVLVKTTTPIQEGLDKDLLDFAKDPQQLPDKKNTDSRVPTVPQWVKNLTAVARVAAYMWVRSRPGAVH